jgi:hypothetical protein
MEKEGEQSSSASAAAASSFRFRDVVEAEDASCPRGCCVEDVLTIENWCVWGRQTDFYSGCRWIGGMAGWQIGR